MKLGVPKPGDLSGRANFNAVRCAKMLVSQVEVSIGEITLFGIKGRCFEVDGA